jgi:hypothetical protein
MLLFDYVVVHAAPGPGRAATVTQIAVAGWPGPGPMPYVTTQTVTFSLVIWLRVRVFTVRAGPNRDARQGRTGRWRLRFRPRPPAGPGRPDRAGNRSPSHESSRLELQIQWQPE